MDHEIHYYVGNDELFVDSTFTIDEVFNDSTQYLFVRNQEEKDYYSGLQLMYGRTMHILTREEWFERLRVHYERTAYEKTGKLSNQDLQDRMPMTYYATHEILKFTSI